MTKYRRPIFILLFLTGFLWTVFLYKVFFVTESKEPIEKIDLITPVTSKAFAQKITLAVAKSRNKKSIENQGVVKAVRESFENENPGKNDQIIRGEEISEIITQKEPVEDLSAGILEMLNDHTELKSLNKDYKQALKDEEGVSNSLEKKVFYQGHYY